MNCIDLDNLNQEDIARFIAYRAHAGQFRRDGVTPYITHPEAVANCFPRHAVSERAVAWLHDVLEDCIWYSASLFRTLGITQEIADAVTVLTKRPGQLYDDYIAEVCKNPLAVRVKIADIRHNMSCNPKEKTLVRYIESLKKLEGCKE